MSDQLMITLQTALQQLALQHTLEMLGDRTTYLGASDIGACPRKTILSKLKTPEADLVIVPWSKSYNDDIRNGMALCKLCHWAFDWGMMGVSNDYQVITSPQIAATPNAPGFLLTLSPFRSRNHSAIRSRSLAGSGILGGTSERMAVVEWQTIAKIIKHLLFHLKITYGQTTFGLDSIENFSSPVANCRHIFTNVDYS